MVREIHDSLGHAFTVLIALLETELAEHATAGEEGLDRTRNMVNVARRGLAELRRVVYSPGAVRTNDRRDLLSALQSLVEASTPPESGWI